MGTNIKLILDKGFESSLIMSLLRGDFISVRNSYCSFRFSTPTKLGWARQQLQTRFDAAFDRAFMEFIEDLACHKNLEEKFDQCIAPFFLEFMEDLACHKNLEEKFNKSIAPTLEMHMARIPPDSFYLSNCEYTLPSYRVSFSAALKAFRLLCRLFIRSYKETDVSASEIDVIVKALQKVIYYITAKLFLSLRVKVTSTAHQPRPPPSKKIPFKAVGTEQTALSALSVHLSTWDNAADWPMSSSVNLMAEVDDDGIPGGRHIMGCQHGAYKVFAAGVLE